MKRNPGPATNDEPSPAPSRAEIETLCILYAVGERGCRAGDLAGRLGLSGTLARAVATSVEPLVSAGWIEVAEGFVTVTVAGHEHLRQRLVDLGVA